MEDVAARLSRPPQVAVIGGGYAGIAAAVSLAECGARVALFESARVLGGRARRVDVDPLTPDNGQHLLVGAYTETLALLAKLGVHVPTALLRTPLHLESPPAFRLQARGFSAAAVPLAFLRAHGLGWRDRLAALRLIVALRRARFRVAPDRPLLDWLAAHGQPAAIVDRLWAPLCIAALNTPPARASAQVFATVLGRTLAGARGAADLLFPRVDLSALIPDPGARFVLARGGAVHTGRLVRSLRRGGGGWQLDDAPATYDALVVATPPWAAAKLLAPFPEAAATRALIAAFEYEPIYTTYLHYGADTRLSAPMLGLEDSLAQWVFDRGQLGGPPGLLAAVISARGAHQSLGLDAIGAHVADALAARGWVRGRPARIRTIAERRATFSCTPGLTRPDADVGLPGIVLAGDYTVADYPATIEAAVVSGVRAAQHVLAR